MTPPVIPGCRRRGVRQELTTFNRKGQQQFADGLRKLIGDAYHLETRIQQAGMKQITSKAGHRRGAVQFGQDAQPLRPFICPCPRRAPNFVDPLEGWAKTQCPFLGAGVSCRCLLGDAVTRLQSCQLFVICR